MLRKLDHLKCRTVELMNKCEPNTKLINGEDSADVTELKQGDLITHRGELKDPETEEIVGYMHSTCLLMYGDLNVGTGVAELFGEDTKFMFQGLFPTAEPHGNFALGILSSTGSIKNAQGWIEMNMDNKEKTMDIRPFSIFALSIRKLAYCMLPICLGGAIPGKKHWWKGDLHE